MPLSQDAAIVLALADTAVPFAFSLEDEAERTRAMEQFRKRTARLRASFGGRKFSDSTNLIRKHRDA